MKRIHLLFAIIACMGSASAALGQAREAQNTYSGLFAQRDEIPPRWAIGNWVGRNDYRKSDIDLQVGDDGRATLTQRMGTNVQTLRGNYTRGRLEIGGQRFEIRQRGEDMELIRSDEKRDYVRLHRVGTAPDIPRGSNSLSIEYPRENDRISKGNVTIRGRSDAAQVEIVIYRDGREVRKLTIEPRRGEWEARTNLQEGRHEIYVNTKERSRSQTERRVRFEVTNGRTLIENPRAGDNVRPGAITVEGTSEADEVEIEIYRGPDRVFIERVRTRNGRFSSRPNLDYGHYTLTVRGKSGKDTTSTDRRGFDVGGRGGDGPVDLRLSRPSDRSRITDGSVEFEGSTSAREVRIQIFRGRDRVQDRKVSVRDGRFYVQIRLDQGRYDALITVQDRGRDAVERKVSFEVTR